MCDFRICTVFRADTGEYERAVTFTIAGGYAFVALDADHVRGLLYASVHGKVPGIHVIHPQTGKHVGHMGPGKRPEDNVHAWLDDVRGAMFAPTDVAVDDANGFVYAVDCSKGRVNQYVSWRK